MPQILYTVDEYVATVKKDYTLWMVFNTVYNDVHAFNKNAQSTDGNLLYLNKEYTDNEARAKFLEFMKKNFPEVNLVEVFDLVSAGYLEYPYLGSIVVDADKESDAYEALVKKYDDPVTGDPLSNNSVLWEITYEEACKFYEESKKFIDDEFAED